MPDSRAGGPDGAGGDSERNALPREQGGALVPPARQERKHVADADRDQDHDEREPDGVKAADVQGPEDDTYAEADGGGDDQTHRSGILSSLRDRDASQRASAAEKAPTNSSTALTGSSD